MRSLIHRNHETNCDTPYQGDKLPALRIIFQRLQAQDHPIRRNLFALDTLPIIRLIEGKA